MTSRPTPRLATGLLAGFLSFALAPAAQAGTVSVVEGVLTITASPNETNIITVERMDNESVVQLGQPATREVIFVRDATNPTTTPVPGLPINPGAILTPGVGCQTVTEPDPNSRRPPIKCTAADFTAINATLSTQQQRTAKDIQR